MIIIRLNGGLANQMFQYALGKSISIKKKIDFKIDISEFDHYQLRKYSLNVFDIAMDFATRHDIDSITGRKSISNLIRQIFRRSIKYNNNLIKEKHYHFDKHILDYGNNLYFDGYWQSHKYFQDISDVLIREFEIKGFKHSLLPKITNTNSVSVHIRRGDYVNNPETLKFHGVLGVDYYQKAMQYIEKNLENPIYFFFSDDLQWVKENIRNEKECIYVEDNPDYIDMMLMKNCHHNIIANSSFSWWGAWLNKNPYKIVVAPKKWFNDPSMDTNDLIPNGWIRI